MRKDFFKDYGFKILFVVFFLLSFVWMGTKQTLLSNSNSVEDWLPAEFQETINGICNSSPSKATSS